MAFTMLLTGVVLANADDPNVAEAAPLPTGSSTTTIAAGAYIIDMGVSPQTKDNGLSPYGLIYSLMIEHLIPVQWVISDTKSTDTTQASTDIDFTYTGPDYTKDYRGGAFIITTEYAAEAAPIIAAWKTANPGIVIDGPTAAPVDVPLFAELTNWPNAVLDDQNGSIAQGYFVNARIPQLTIEAATGQDKIAYEFKDPALLDECDDIYVMPHADPEWATHQNLVPFNDRGGYIWAACHAVSVLENVADPLDPNPDPDMNFLSTNGLVDFGDHRRGTPLYTYTTDGSDPIMQFTGRMDLATENGSEQIYLPAAGSAWNPGTNVLVWDTDHPDLASEGGVSPGEAVKMIYGRGFDDPTNGLVMYEAGHSHNKGTVDDVSAQRAFFNLHLLAGLERGMEVDVTVPEPIVAGDTVTVSATITGGTPDYGYQWISTCGGTFGAQTGTSTDGLVSTTFTAPNSAQDCIIRIAVGDTCGRTSFAAGFTRIVEVADLGIDKTDGLVSVAVGEPLTYTLTVTNSGPNDATNVTVLDAWPSTYLSFVSVTSSQGSCTFNGTQISCALGTILYTEPTPSTATITVQATVRSTATGVITNTATVSTPDQLDPNPGNNTSTDVTTISGMRIVKTADPAVFDANLAPVDVTFTFTLSNVGPDPLNTVTITDTEVPSCTTPAYLSGDDDPTSPGTRDFILQVGEIWLFECTVGLSADLTNTVTASALTTGGDPVAATDTVFVDAITPSVTIDKGIDGATYTDGGDVLFSITVTNSGDTDLFDVVVDDAIGAVDVPDCDRYLGDIAQGDSVTYTCAIAASLVPQPTGTNSATVTATGPNGGILTDTDTSGYTVVASELDITKTPIRCGASPVVGLTDPAFYVGDQVCYQIEVTNTSTTATHENVVLTDTLPTGLTHDTTTVVAPVTLIDDNFDHDANNANLYQFGFTEIGETTDADSNDVTIQIGKDYCTPTAVNDNCVLVEKDGVGLSWPANLSAGGTFEISFDYEIVKNSNSTGQIDIACWTGATWQVLRSIDLPSATVPQNGSYPGALDPVSLSIPASCQRPAAAGGNIGIINQGDPLTTNDNLDFAVDNVSIATATASVFDDFENYKSDRYYSEGNVPGWAEYNETTDRFSGDVQARAEGTWNSNCVTIGACAVQITNPDNGITWPDTYSGYRECTVEFDYRVFDTDGNANEFIGVGGLSGGVWVDAATIPLPLTAISTSYVSYSLTLTAGGTPNLSTFTSLGVRSGPNNNGGEDFAIDNVSIGCISEWDTTNHPTIIDSTEGIDLGPGDTMTATVTATVTADGAVNPRELTNVAGISSDQQTTPSIDTATVDRAIPGIQIVKTVDPTITDPTTPVTYTFEVTNTGNEPLDNVVLSDPDLATNAPGCTITGPTGDTGADGVLGLDEVWTYSCTTTVASSFNNTATITGDTTTLSSDPTNTADPVASVSDSDSAFVDVVVSGIQVTKTASPLIIRTGQNVTYSYAVTLEPGTSEPLESVTVTDDKCSPVTGPTSGDGGVIGTLELGETWTYSCSTTLTEDTLNTVTASGLDRIGNTASDTDTASVDVINPGFTITKTVQEVGVGTPSDYVEIADGASVEYTITVTNTGDDPLTGVVVTDNRCTLSGPTGDTGGDLVLGVGEVWTYTCTTTPTDDVVNTANASAKDSLNRTYTAFDTAEVNVLLPSIALLKVNDGSLIFTGESVTYTIIVFNDGDIDFTNVAVTDDNCSPVTGPSNDGGILGTLEVGEGWFYTCTTPLYETTTNTASVTADDGGGNSATDSDTSRVRVHEPLLDIVKTASESVVLPGGSVTYTFDVQNTSVCDVGDSACEQDHEITNVVVSDDSCSPVTYVGGDDGDAVLSIGEIWTYSCTTTLTEPTLNIASAVGDDVLGQEIPRLPVTDDAFVDVNSTQAENDINQTIVDVPVSGSVLTNDTDDQGDNQTVVSALADTDGDGLIDDPLPIGTSTPIYGVDETGAVVPAGTITLNAAGTYTYVPALGFEGTVPVEYTINDDNAAGAASDSATLTIEVFGADPDLNDPPIAQDDTNSTESGVPVSANLIEPNDSDPDGDALSVIEVLMDIDGDGFADDRVTVGDEVVVYGTTTDGNIVPAGTLVVNADGTYTYTPDANFAGEVPANYTISDGALTDDANLLITVERDYSNSTTAIDDATSTPVNTTVSGDVSTNDSDAEGHTQTVSSAEYDSDGDGIPDTPLTIGSPTLVFGVDETGTVVSAGTLTLYADGTYTYVPATDFEGTVLVEYIATDSHTTNPASDPALLTIDVYGNVPLANDPPEAINDTNTTDVGVPVSSTVLTNDVDPDGDPLTVTEVLADLDGDGTLESIGAPNGVGDYPLVVVYGTDLSGNIVPAGTLEIGDDGLYTFSPNPTFSGDVPVQYTAEDPGGLFDTANLDITVLPATTSSNNTDAVDDFDNGLAGTTVSGDASLNDFDAQTHDQEVVFALVDTDGDGVADDPLPIGVATTVWGINELGDPEVAGTMTLDADGTYTLVSNPAFTGTLTADYTVVDSHTTQPAYDTATITIVMYEDVAGVADPPIALDDSNVTESGVPVSGTVLTNDVDPDGGALEVVDVLMDTDGGGLADDPVAPGAATPVYGTDINGNIVPAGTLVVNADGTYTFTPNDTFIGDVPSSYTIRDNGGLTDSANLDIVVLPDSGNDTYTNDDANIGAEAEPQVGNIIANDSDPEADDQVVRLIDTNGDGIPDTAPVAGTPLPIFQGGVQIGTLEIDPETGAYTWLPEPGFIGTVAVPYTATDGTANDTATLYLTTWGNSDFGDAPASYGSASATVTDSLSIGGTPSVERTDYNDADAAADTDDGVDLTAARLTANGYELDVAITNTTGESVWVCGWIDLDKDGVFEAGEEQCDEVLPGESVGTLIWPEAGGLTGMSFARFRVAPTLEEANSPSGATATGEVEDYEINLATLPVTVAYFTSAAANGRFVDVSWWSGTETANAGYLVLGDDGNGGVVQLSDFIEGAGDSLVPLEYSTRVKYIGDQLWLADIDAYGVETLHGPYAIGETMGSVPEPVAIDWGAAAEATGSPQKADKPGGGGGKPGGGNDGGGSGPAVGSTVRLDVTVAGVHRVSYADLVAAGVDWAGADMDSLAVIDAAGTPVPVAHDGSQSFGLGSWVEFYGEPLDTIYTGTNVYRLVVDPALVSPMATDNTRPPKSNVAADATYLHTEVFEEQLSYSSSAVADDPWAWARLSSRYGSSQPLSLTVVADLATGGEALISVDVWGANDSVGPDDHAMALAVNGVLVGALAFDGLDAATIEGVVPAGVLVAGDNIVTVTLSGPAGTRRDTVLIDRISLSYERTIAAVDGVAVFEASSDRVEVGGFTGSLIEVLRRDAAGTTRIGRTSVSQKNDGTFTVSFAGTGSAATYVVTQASSVLVPALADMPVPTGLLDGAADLLIISHPAFSGGLGDLIAARQAQGLAVKVVEVDDLYAAYTGGVFDPAAISAYIDEAAVVFENPAVLLVGGDSYDYRDYTGVGSVAYIPTFYGSVGVGDVVWSPMDPAFVDLDDDQVPDLALGRFPVRNLTELDNIIAKTLAYSADGTALFSADNGFGSYADGVADGLGADVTITRAYLDDTDLATARSTILSEINAGVGLTVYFGHSSADQWATGLLRTVDVASMTNGTDPTVAIQFGCWNTFFSDPAQQSLGTALANQPGGASAVVGATTLTNSVHDAMFGAHLTEALGSQATIGEALVVAKQGLALVTSAPDINMGWTLLGDPTMQIGN